MPSLLDLGAELFGSLVRLGIVFAEQVAVWDPLALVSFLIGAVLTAATFGFVGYLVLGAALDAVGLPM